MRKVGPLHTPHPHHPHHHPPPLPAPTTMLSQESCTALGFWLQPFCSLWHSALQVSWGNGSQTQHVCGSYVLVACSSPSLREITFSGTLLISDRLARPRGAPWAAPCPDRQMGLRHVSHAIQEQNSLKTLSRKPQN